jgi:hypothetical protein
MKRTARTDSSTISNPHAGLSIQECRLSAAAFPRKGYRVIARKDGQQVPL